MAHELTSKEKKLKVFCMAVQRPIPPPPPPLVQQKKSSKKLIIAIVIVLVIILLGVVIYFAFAGMYKNPSGSPTPTPTAGTSSTPSSAATSTPSSNGASISEANSLQYSVDIVNSSGQLTGSYVFYTKTVGPATMIRIEFTDSSDSNMIYIVNGATQQFWVSTNGEWVDLSSAYASQYATWFGIYNSYKNNLASWAGFGDYTYTAPDGSSVRIYDISVNPTLPDSLFQHS